MPLCLRQAGHSDRAIATYAMLFSSIIFICQERWRGAVPLKWQDISFSPVMLEGLFCLCVLILVSVSWMREALDRFRKQVCAVWDGMVWGREASYVLGVSELHGEKWKEIKWEVLAEFTEEKMWHEKKGNVQGEDRRKVIKHQKC